MTLPAGVIRNAKGTLALSELSVVHFAVYRLARSPKFPGSPVSLCGHSKFPDRLACDEYPERFAKPCERCALLVAYAKANGVPLRHQLLDEVLRTRLEDAEAQEWSRTS